MCIDSKALKVKEQLSHKRKYVKSLTKLQTPHFQSIMSDYVNDAPCRSFFKNVVNSIYIDSLY